MRNLRCLEPLSEFIDRAMAVMTPRRDVRRFGRAARRMPEMERTTQIPHV